MSIKIIIKDTKNNKYEIQTDPTSTIELLKKTIKEKDDLNNKNLLLIFSGKILKDECTIESYNIADGNEIVKLYKDIKAEQPKSTTESVHVEPPILSPNNQTDQPVNDQVDQNVNMFEQGNNLDPVPLNQNMRNMMFNMAKQQYPELTEEEFNNAIATVNTGAGFGNTGVQRIALQYTEQEKNDVMEIIAMGFNEGDVHQCYNACDKNKEITVNMLFDMGEEVTAQGVGNFQQQFLPQDLQNPNFQRNSPQNIRQTVPQQNPLPTGIQLPNLQQHDIPNLEPYSEPQVNQVDNSTDNRNENIESLITMGFAREQAINALTVCNGNLSGAINMLLNGDLN